MLDQNFQNISLQPKAAKKEISGLKELYKEIKHEASLDRVADNPVLKGIEMNVIGCDHQAQIQLMKQVKEIHDDIAQRIIDDKRMPFNVNQKQMQDDKKVLELIINTLPNAAVKPLVLTMGI